MDKKSENSNMVSPAPQDSDNESVHSNTSSKSNTSHKSAASVRSHASSRSGRSSRSSQGSHHSRLSQHQIASGNVSEEEEVEERRSVQDSGDEQERPGSAAAGNDARPGRPHSRTSDAASIASARSPSRSRSNSGSPVRSRNNSGSPARSRSNSRSPARSRSISRSPARSRSISRSPARSRSKSGSPLPSRSKSGSPARSRSRSGSPARSRSRSGSPARSRSRSGSPARSRSRSGSPARSRSKSGSPARSRSRSGSPARSRSKSGSPARSRSRSGSHARSRSKSGSPARSRSRSGSPARSRSRSGSRARSGSRSRSRSGSRSRSRSPARANRRSHAISDSDSDSDAQSSKKQKTSSKRSRDSAGSDDESPDKKRHHNMSDSDGEQEGNERKSSDGRSSAQPTDNVERAESSEDEGVLPDGESKESEFTNDFDAMRARQKELMGSRRRKMNVDVINDNEHHISIIVTKMRQAAEVDRECNLKHKPATNKMALLELAMRQISKTDLLEGFLDANILTALTDWLAPMPDKSLPAGAIRDNVIRFLCDLPLISQDMLKTSGIGKAIMYLYRHPRETRANKERCGGLISKWSRPIFNNSDDFKSMTKQERFDRDLALKESGPQKTKKEVPVEDPVKILRPGDPGWCYRARVPRSASLDYVVRPTNSIVDSVVVRKNCKVKKSRFEKHMMQFTQKKTLSKTIRAVKMSIQGRDMPL